MDSAPRCGDPGTDYRVPSALAGFSGCEVLQGNLEYSYSRQTSVPEFRQFRAVRGFVNLFGTSELRDLSGLSSLEHCGGFTLRSSQVRDLSGLDRLEVVEGDLSVYDTPSLESLHGLERVREVRGRLMIGENERLTSLAALESLCRVEGDFYVFSNPNLPRSEIDNLLARAEVGGRVVLEPMIGP
jgi:hypothetical protein